MAAGNGGQHDRFRGATQTGVVRFGRTLAAVGSVWVALSACTDGGPPAADSGSPTTDSAAVPAGDVATTVDSVAVTVWFRRGEEPVAVERMVPADNALVGALEAQLAGPTAAEYRAGIESWFSAATRGMLRSAAVEDGLAVIDFADYSRVIPNASSSFGSTALLAELNATVFANTDATAVEYRFEGSCDAFGEWVQRGCIRYERREP